MDIRAWTLALLGSEGDRLPGPGILPLPDHDPSAWEIFYAAVKRGGLAPLLYERLSARPPGTVPRSVLARLKADFFRNLVKNVRASKEVEQVLRAFHADAIPVILFKGLHLAESVYGNIGARVFGDVDLLVGEADFGRAVEIMRALGFSALVRGLEIEEADNEYHFIHDRTGFSVDLHRDLFKSRAKGRLPMKDVWERSRPAARDPLRRELAPEDLVIYLCYHVCQHILNVQIKFAYDIQAAITAYSDLRWPDLVRRAKASGLDRPVYLGFRLSERLFGTLIPPDILEGLRPESFHEEFIKIIENRLVNPGRFAAGKFSNFAAQWSAQPSWPARGRFLAGLLFPPKWWLFHHYGARGSPMAGTVLRGRWIMEKAWIYSADALKAIKRKKHGASEPGDSPGGKETGTLISWLGTGV